MPKNRNRIKKTAERKQRKIEGKMGRVKARHLFTFEVRRWREGARISRKDVARVAGVEEFVLCYMEHNKVHLVRIGDVLSALNALRSISPIPKEKEDEIRGLLKAAVRNKLRRACHRPHSSMTKRR